MHEHDLYKEHYTSQAEAREHRDAYEKMIAAQERRLKRLRRDDSIEKTFEEINRLRGWYHIADWWVGQLSFGPPRVHLVHL